MGLPSENHIFLKSLMNITSDQNLRQRKPEKPALILADPLDDKKDRIFIQPNSNLEILLGGDDWKTPLILTFLSFLTRFYQISKANFVVWDEAHFGKFASYYIKRQFYFGIII